MKLQFFLMGLVMCFWVRSAPGQTAESSMENIISPVEAEKIEPKEIELEELESDWESVPRYPSMEISKIPRIKDIVEPSSDYAYASFGRPDPFKRPSIEEILGVTTIVAKSVIQAHPLSELKCVGYWQLADGQKRVMIQTSDSKEEPVVAKEGDPIASGKILKIEPKKIIVRLYRIQANGIRTYADKEMRIGEPTLPRTEIIFAPGKEPEFIKSGTAVPSSQSREASQNIGTSSPPKTEPVVPSALGSSAEVPNKESKNPETVGVASPTSENVSPALQKEYQQQVERFIESEKVPETIPQNSGVAPKLDKQVLIDTIMNRK